MAIMKPSKIYGQRELMKQLVLKFGHDRERVCAAYAAVDRRDEVRRVSDVTRRSSESYASEMWASSHRPSDPWIEVFCSQHRIPL